MCLVKYVQPQTNSYLILSINKRSLFYAVCNGENTFKIGSIEVFLLGHSNHKHNGTTTQKDIVHGLLYLFFKCVLVIPRLFI